ncbi:hypothetical protein VTH06DRAFT_3538 [Thermothelomyces fergusii]
MIRRLWFTALDELLDQIDRAEGDIFIVTDVPPQISAPSNGRGNPADASVGFGGIMRTHSSIHHPPGRRRRETYFTGSCMLDFVTKLVSWVICHCIGWNKIRDGDSMHECIESEDHSARQVMVAGWYLVSVLSFEVRGRRRATFNETATAAIQQAVSCAELLRDSSNGVNPPDLTRSVSSGASAELVGLDDAAVELGN